MTRRLVALLVLAACGGGSAGTPATTPTAAPAPTRAPSGPWTTVPALGVRVACDGKLRMVGEQALVTCSGRLLLSIMLEPDAHTLDEAIANRDGERSVWLQAGGGDVKRTKTLHRRAYENTGNAGTNYWVDVLVELDGRVVACQSVSMAPNGTKEIAARAGDVCETVSLLEGTR